MESRISESDWKLFRRLKPLALERFCQRALAELVVIASDSSKSCHERFLKVFKQLQERNLELAAAFDDLRRSSALLQLSRVQWLGLLTDEELAEFSDETRRVVAGCREMWAK